MATPSRAAERGLTPSSSVELGAIPTERLAAQFGSAAAEMLLVLPGSSL